VTKQLDWASAVKYCADRNAQLVAIANKEEQKALTLYLKYLNKTSNGEHTRVVFSILAFAVTLLRHKHIINLIWQQNTENEQHCQSSG